MIFNSSKKSNDVVAADTSSSLTLHNAENQKEQNSDIKKNHRKRNRNKKENDDDDQIDEPIVLPTYCDLILQGLQSRESFSAIKKPFLEQTSAHLLRQYSNSTSKSFHYSFIVALTEKFPALNYLNKDVD
ncbi:unnamed protein product, partial [Rotaria magnacalcarata]